MNNNENNKTTNTISVVGFILSFFIGIVGLILSIIGLKRSKEYNSGKGLSIAGIIVSSLNIIASIIIILVWSLILSAFNLVTDLKDEAIEIGNDITTEITKEYLCSISYECEENINGWTCKYKSEDGEEKKIKCDYNNDFNNINKKDLVGKWKPKRIEDTIEPTTIEDYFGTYSSNENFALVFNEDETYINSLTEKNTSGKYEIKKKNIILENDNNYTLSAEIIDKKIDCLILIDNNGTSIYLYKDNSEIIEETKMHNTNTIKYKYYTNEYEEKELKELIVNGTNIELNETIYFSEYKDTYTDEFFIFSLERISTCGKPTHKIFIYDYKGNLLLKNNIIKNEIEFDSLVYTGDFELEGNKLTLEYDTNKDFDCNTSTSIQMSCDELNSIKDIALTELEIEYTYENNKFINERVVEKEYFKDSDYYEKYITSCK